MNTGLMVTCPICNNPVFSREPDVPTPCPSCATSHNPRIALRVLRMTLEPSVKQRVCLFCGRMFTSSGPANRRCPTCDQAIARRPWMVAAPVAERKGRHDREAPEPVERPEPAIEDAIVALERYEETAL